MFISLSKTVARFGGIRLGAGLRITKNNAIWMSFIVLFACLMKAIWAAMIMGFWMAYAVYYGLFIGIKKLIQIIVIVVKNKKEGNQADA